jgi:O-antigen/teichoic acid export membrane protein
MPHKIFLSFYQQTLKNNLQLFWQGLEKTIRIIVGLFVTGYAARFFGPNDYQYVVILISILAFAVTVTNFGTNSQVVKGYIGNEISTEVEHLLCALYFSLCIVTCIILISINLDGLKNIISLTFLYLFILLYSFGRLSDLHKFRYEAKSNLHVYARLELLVFTLFSLLKIYFLYTNLSSLFILIYSIDVLVLFFLTRPKFRKSIFSFSVTKRDYQTFKNIVSTSSPIFLSNLMIGLVLSFDKFFLFQYNETQTSFYIPATVLISVLLFIPTIIGSSFAGKLTHSFINCRFDDYNSLKKTIYFYTLIFTVFISLVTVMFSNTIVELIFGSDFNKSSSYLAFIIWTLPMIAFVSLRNRFLMIEDMFSTVLFSSIILIAVLVLAMAWNSFIFVIPLQYLSLIVWMAGGVIIPLVLPSIRYHFNKELPKCQ